MFGSIAMWIWPAAPQNTGTNYAWCTVYGVVGTNGTLHRRTSNIWLWECTHSHQAHATCAKGFDRYNHLLPCWRFRGPFFPLFPILLGLCASCMSINAVFCYICVSFNQVYGLMVRTLIPPPSNRFCVCFFLISFSCGCCCRLSRIIIIILLLFFFLLVCALIVCVREMYPLQIHPSVGVETAPRIERCIRASVWQLFCLPSIFVFFFRVLPFLSLSLSLFRSPLDNSAVWWRWLRCTLSSRVRSDGVLSRVCTLFNF